MQTVSRFPDSFVRLRRVTEALRAEFDTCFVLTPMPPEPVKGIAEPVLTYAVRDPAVPAATS